MRAQKSQQGLSLIELMISIALGLVLIVGLSNVYLNSNRTAKELQKSGQQIENGRYALELMTNEMRHAGFYGKLGMFSDPTAVPDPCALTEAALQDSLMLPLQVFRAANLATRADLTATACAAGLLDDDNLVPGSDVVVVRRADTSLLAVGDTAVLGEVYLQANAITADVQIGNGAAITATSTATGTAATILKLDGSAAEIRKLHVHVFFVAPCRMGSGAGGMCTNADDSVPTLKMLSLQVDPGTNALAMQLVPLVAGIEVLKVEMGVDDSPSDVNQLTGRMGDGIVDAYVEAPTLDQMGNAISARLFVLARNTDPTSNHVDTKSYLMSATGLVKGPMNDGFKRHAFLGAVLLSNLGGRKEIPL